MTRAGMVTNTDSSRSRAATGSGRDPIVRLIEVQCCRIVDTFHHARHTLGVSRLFVALWPPDHVIGMLEELHRKDQVGARFVMPENWHVTLRFVGNADPNDMAAALDDAEFRPCTVTLGPAVDVGNGRTLFVPAAGADGLAEEVVRVTRHLGDEPIRNPYLGHLTIARMKKRANMPRALGELIQADWEPTEVALVESRLLPDGAVYDTLQTWPI